MRRAMRLVILPLLLAGCMAAPPVREVSLAPTMATGAVTADASPADRPLRIAAASVVSPQETIRNYGVFFAYLEKQVGRPLELVQRQTYEETYDLLKYGTLDIAMVCTYVYVLGHAEIGLELLAGPEVNGRAEYQSFIITRSDSGIMELDDLAGKRFAFTDPLSTSGRLYPLALLRARNLDPGTFFGSTTYTYSHDNSIKAVAEGVVDAAAVDSLVYEQWVKLNPDLGANLQVIDRSAAMPSPPMVVSNRMDPELRNAFREALLHMHEDPAGRQILTDLGIDRFVPQDDADYAAVRALAEGAGLQP